MSANIAVIYSSDELQAVAAAIGEAAQRLSANVRLLRVQHATLGDLEWADGVAFGTPIGDGRPAPALMEFIAQMEPLWSSARLFDKVVSMFTDEPEHYAPDSIDHPIYEALYRWGAVIVGPRAYELELDARPRENDPQSATGLSGPRLRTAHYRGRRLTALAITLAAERVRRMRLEL